MRLFISLALFAAVWSVTVMIAPMGHSLAFTTLAPAVA